MAVKEQEPHASSSTSLFSTSSTSSKKKKSVEGEKIQGLGVLTSAKAKPAKANPAKWQPSTINTKAVSDTLPTRREKLSGSVHPLAEVREECEEELEEGEIYQPVLA